jgi:hypothetical protein
MAEPDPTPIAERTLKLMHVAGQFGGRVAFTASRLREIADEIERVAQRISRVPSAGTTSASSLASDLMHTLMWGLANASPDGIVKAAAEYDFHMAQED